MFRVLVHGWKEELVEIASKELEYLGFEVVIGEPSGPRAVREYAGVYWDWLKEVSAPGYDAVVIIGVFAEDLFKEHDTVPAPPTADYQNDEVLSEVISIVKTTCIECQEVYIVTESDTDPGLSVIGINEDTVDEENISTIVKEAVIEAIGEEYDKVMSKYLELFEEETELWDWYKRKVIEKVKETYDIIIEPLAC